MQPSTCTLVEETTCQSTLKRPLTSSFSGSPPTAFTVPMASGPFGWSPQGNGRVRVGLTDYLQQLNGDVAFAHVKPVGTKLAVGDEIAELETIKANVSLFAPVSGTVVEVNPDLDLSPEIINQEPYGKGWLAVIEATTGKPIARSCSIRRPTCRRCGPKQKRS